MLFNSLPFLYAFLPVTYLVYWRLKTKNQRYVWLALTGYVFYGFWDWRFCGLMALSTAISYSAGLGQLRAERPSARKFLLVLPIVADLLILGFFKYAGFFLDNAGALAHRLGVPWSLPAIKVILPVGISFYTFHTITYIVDSYRRLITPTRNVFEFACYVSLFSQLVAGPIVRFRQIERDLEEIDQADRRRGWDLGWSFFAIGMLKKVLVADTLAAVIDPALADWRQLGTLEAWGCMLGYTYQLYFDFSGYSDMAVGLGHLFGIRIPQNFDSPYKALDPADFWRRWHISLSSCLRDYLYIPLGGNRGGAAKTLRNLLITMLLGGLWHGANWTFVLWGAYHGMLLILVRVFHRPWEALPAGVRRGVTFLLVLLGWVLFRAENFGMAVGILGAMFSWVPAAGMPGTVGLAAMLLVAAAVAHAAPNSWELKHRWGAVPALGLAGMYVLCLVVIYGGRPTPFLYFQF
jgi:alginate O-acetyltransferase complex protein AlgI